MKIVLENEIMNLKVLRERIKRIFTVFKTENTSDVFIPAYRIVEIIQEEDEEYSVKIQMINKSMIFTAKPEEILAKDEVIDQFSPRDVRTLTYLGYLSKNSPKYKILAHRLLENDHRVVFILKGKGNKKIISKTVKELQEEKNIVNNMSSKDAQIVGYAIASESAVDEKNNKEISRKQLENSESQKRKGGCMGKIQYKIEDFSKNGFAGPFKVYEPEEAKNLLRSIRRHNLDRSKAIFNNDVNYDRHFDIPELASHIVNKEILEKLKVIFGEDILCWRTEFFPKFPGSEGTEWHQVANYQYANGKPMIAPTENTNIDYMDLTVWTAFTDTTIETACMKFLPGSHKKKYYDETKPVEKGRIAEYSSFEANTGFYGYNFSEFKIDPKWEPSESEVVNLEMQAGEFVIFTAKCVHGSCSNTTQNKTRFSISSRYVPTSVRVYPDQTHFFSHGGNFDLKNYGTVLVSGKDIYHHNRIKNTDVHGVPF